MLNDTENNWQGGNAHAKQDKSCRRGRYLIKAVVQLSIIPLREGMQAMLCCNAQQSAVEHQVLIGAFRLPLACSI